MPHFLTLCSQALRLRPGWRLGSVLIIGCLLNGSAVCAQALAERTHYDIPEGNAIKTLKLVAKQGDVDIMFAASVARGVRTKAVEGSFTPGEALDLMLEGTTLSVVQDPRTRAFAIVGAANAEPAENPDLQRKPTSTTRNIDDKHMNAKNTETGQNRGSALKTFLALALASGGPDLLAQNDEEEVFELTPFEVRAEDNTGYRATSTLAGTRMRMNLDDVGSSVSVFTKELMDDIGAVDNETLLAYGLGTEVGGTRGNFINPNTEGLENENLVDPQSNNRIRGLTSADTTRNYFKSDIPWDGYNTNRIDVQRGANSILFGLGSPAGIINNTTSTAAFRDHNEVQIRYDQFGSLRGSGTFNRVLMEDQLAIRFDLLSDNQEYRQRPTFEDDNRFHAAITYQPEGLNTDTTTTRFSLDFEKGEIEANRPRMVVPLDSVSSYFIPSTENGFVGAEFANGGVFGPSSDIVGPGGRTYNPIGDANATPNIRWLATAANSNAWPIFAFDALNPGSFSVYEDGFNSEGSFLQVFGRNDTDGQSAIVVNDGAYVNPVAASNRPQDVYVRGKTQNVFFAPRLVTQGKQRVASDNGVAFPGFWRDSSFTSTSQYDFMNNLIDGNNKLERQEFDVLELQVRNTFLDNRLGYQVSYFRQDYDSRQDANLGAIFAPEIQVEVNSTDPLSDPTNLAANPTAGRAFVDFELRLRGGSEDIRSREAVQAQLFATLDADDFMEDGFLSSLFGRHDFTAMFKNRELEQTRREFNSIGVDEQTMRTLGGSAPDDPNLNPRYNPQFSDPGPGARMVRLANAVGSVQPRIRVYLDAQGPNLTQIQPFGDPVIPSGSYSYRGFVASPIPGFTAEDAAEEWIAPNGDVEIQANNPANYSGLTDNRGNIGIVTATDSREALEYLTARRFYDKEDIDTQAFVWSGSFLDGSIVGMYGWREDEADQVGLEHDYGQIAENSVTGRTGGPNFDTNSQYLRATAGSFQSRNWSAKVNVTKLFFDTFKMDDNLPFNVSVLYNEGQVQSPQPGRRDVLLNDLAPATGATTDRSIAISSKNGKYSLRATKFDTVQSNANAGSVAASENWRIEQVISNSVANGVVWIEEGRSAFADAVLDNGDDVDDPNEINEARSQVIRDAGFDNVLEWGQHVASAYRDFESELFTRWPAANSWITSGAPGTSQIGINFPDDTVFIEDNESFGMEYEFVARPTENWNLMFNASKTEVLRSKVFGDDVNDVLDFIVGELSGPAGQVPLWGPEGQFGIDRTAPFLGQLITNRALLGTPTGELRKWKYNMVSSYNFTEGRLNGFGVGAGARYEDSQVVGFPPRYIDPVTGETLPDRSRPDAALSVDIENPYRDSSRTTYDLWFKYQRRIHDKVDWRIQLNIFNVGNDKGTVPLFVNPDGTIGTRGIRMGRSWQLANTFTF